MNIFNLFKFDSLFSIENAPLSTHEKKQLIKINIDKIHFSHKYPTIFFKEVKDFEKTTLKEIIKIHHNLWNYKKVMFLYVVSLTEIRIYNCNSKPEKLDDIEKSLEEHEITRCFIEDKENLNQILKIFSAYAIDSGSIWAIENHYLDKIKIDKRIDKFLVSSLVNLAKKLEDDDIDLDVIHSLIMRSLFIMYLEDKEATPKKYYEHNGKTFASYFDVLEDKEASYAFFKKIQDNFNGNVFPVTEIEKKQIEIKHLKLVKKCFLNGDLNNESLFDNWRIFKFDIIDIELLSQIYENFLSEIDKESTGSYYTPPELVELMLNEVLPINAKNYKIKILDPTCGSGIFLVEAYKRIVQRWQNANPNTTVSFKILKNLLKDSIFGIELNKNSIKVTTFSLYLAMLDFLNPAKLWYLGDEKFPYLIKDNDHELKKQGNNLFRADTILLDHNDIEMNFDIIIGNPPYSKKKIPLHIIEYCQKEGFSLEFVIPFIHKSTLLAPNGKIALLAPTKILTNTLKPAQNFRNWLFNENYVEKIYNLSILRKAPKTFGGQLFSSAIVPASIYFFQPKAPERISKTIEYWAPKTYIKNHLAEGVIIDSSDIKYLPRSECNKKNTKIWKIAQWGSLNDLNLLNKLETNSISFKKFIEKNNIITGVGFQLLSKKETKIKEDKNLCKLPYLKASSINRFYTPNNNYLINDSLYEARPKTQEFYLNLYKCTNLQDIPSITKFKMTAKFDEIFKAPHFVLKKGFIDSDKICSSYIDYDCSFRDGVYGFYSKEQDETILKYLSILFSSSYAHYFLLMTASSYTVEREQIMLDEYLSLPLPIMSKEDIQEISSLIDEEMNSCNNILRNKTIDETTINNKLYNMLHLTENEKILINDSIKYKIDLFHKGNKSIAIKPLNTNNPETINYSIKLCKELNGTLFNSDLQLIPSIYKISQYTPLSVIMIQFIDRKFNQNEEIKIFNSDTEFNQILLKLNKYTLKEYSKGIFVQKNITYFDDDKIYIVKPNQKRFWNLSSAIEDAQNITLEIMSMY
ncbi:N-6 DNA methylase [Aliarcobacter butzleri 7h1h]|uniref:HsdM family class I SAM-dependent methyltransferase n=1 Tax=Aliarcobacter butzleri TaxID=28197 RepID=UPI00035B9F3A|nr:N-6 DNA methylase [Aliarcobacter butzleri]AGR78392.1 N-6 DNA methylase [Aliarcobacter butzleri 7h1h]